LGICTIFLFPLLAHWLKHWSEKWEIYDNPLAFLGQALHFLATLVETPWAQWVFFLVIGITIGLWTDWLLRKFSRSRSYELYTLGTDMRVMATDISICLNDHIRWPAGLGVPSGDLVSLFLRVRKAGYWMPSDQIFERREGGGFLSNYLHQLGTLLRDEHFDEAKALSQEGEKQFQSLR
jgi:hypothetical protein